jgi:hypothetical protein
LRPNERGDRENYHYGQRHLRGIRPPFDGGAFAFDPRKHSAAHNGIHQGQHSYDGLKLLLHA